MTVNHFRRQILGLTSMTKRSCCASNRYARKGLSKDITVYKCARSITDINPIQLMRPAGSSLATSRAIAVADSAPSNETTVSKALAPTLYRILLRSPGYDAFRRLSEGARFDSFKETASANTAQEVV